VPLLPPLPSGQRRSMGVLRAPVVEPPMAGGQATGAAKAPQVPTVAELRAAVPKECFRHSAPRALVLVLRDGVVLATIFLLATSFLRVPGSAGGPLAAWEWAGWAVYGFAEGTAAVGWWVLAHECGHGGFSQYRTLNDAVGWVLHSLLLVPYFSWQFSHAKHHSKTNHLMDGESHVPDTREELRSVGFESVHRIVGDDCFAVIELFNHLVVGWPAYLLFNVTGATGSRSASPCRCRAASSTTSGRVPRSSRRAGACASAFPASAWG